MLTVYNNFNLSCVYLLGASQSTHCRLPGILVLRACNADGSTKLLSRDLALLLSLPCNKSKKKQKKKNIKTNMEEFLSTILIYKVIDIATTEY
jgi:uncharacterized protein (DUF302 family)